MNPEEESHYSLHPVSLMERWKKLSPAPEWIVIDEVQKVPKLLDVAHLGIENHGIKFALTGSSARKLKRGGANLLAGRAFVYHLHPLTVAELGADFDLSLALHWGTLPRCLALQDDADRRSFLRAYAHTYLKEEIQVEQAVRKIEPFRRFLEVAAQMNGEILNFSRLAREAGIEPRSVERYFAVLEDTLLGFKLPAFARSIRKRQLTSPKFYLFDLGVTRALRNHLETNLAPGTYAYGKAFEHFLLLEILRGHEYRQRDCRLAYWKTKDDAEIDLVIECPSRETLLVEIKSAPRVDPADLRTLKTAGKEWGTARRLVLSGEPMAREVDGIEIYPWREGLDEILGG